MKEISDKKNKLLEFKDGDINTEDYIIILKSLEEFNETNELGFLFKLAFFSNIN